MTTENPTRRRIVAGTAAAVAGAVSLNALAIAQPQASIVEKPFTAAEPDLVLGLIEEHRRLLAIVIASGKSEPRSGHPDLPAWEARNEQASDAEHGAAWELVTTAPTTAAGVLAFAYYVPMVIVKDHWDFAEPALITLAEAINALIGGEFA